MSAEHLAPIHFDLFTMPGLAVEQGRRPMQDVVGGNVAPNELSIAGAYDGHGPKGLTYAEAANTAMTEMGRGRKMTVQDLALRASDVLYNLSSDPRLEGKDGGSTATTAFIEGNEVAFVQIGDSGARFYPLADATRSTPLTPAHNATNPAEVSRVQAQGGHLTVNGYFSDAQGEHRMIVSRSIGDPGYDYVSHEPEVTEHTITEPGTLIIATDGLWETDPYDIAEQLTMFRNADPSRMPPERRGRPAAFLARVGVATTRDDAGVVAVEFGIVRA